MINYLQNKKCIFFRVEPNHLSIINDSKFLIHQSIDINPRTTAILNLQQTDEALLDAMRKNTRYSIRFAGKQNLVVKEEKNLAVFWDLLQQTAKHDNFTTHVKKHYEAIFNFNSIYQLTAFKDDIAIATAVFVGFGNTFTYLFAASDYKRHQLLAPYLLQWEAIKLGQKLGYKYYDFFGIAPRMKGVKSKEKGISEHEYDERH
ncbi:MAG: Methicillin resistance protein, partial [Candidatus Magasanikbacteria bacterium GW2011_GWA2_37_8]